MKLGAHFTVQTLWTGTPGVANLIPHSSSDTNDFWMKHKTMILFISAIN